MASFDSFEDQDQDQSAASVGLDDEKNYTDMGMGYEHDEQYDYDDEKPQLTVDSNHSPTIYGFGVSTPNPDHVSPFESAHADDSTFTSHAPILPDPSFMQEEAHARREWRRLNAIHLEEKEKREKEMRNQIIKEAEEYKQSFYEKRKLNCEKNKENNREREKIYLSNQEKFHKEAHQHYWKAIAEIIPREVPNIEKRRGKKEVENKPSVHIIQGPKPGKPTDLARMRQMILKLKQNPPSHMMPPPPKEEKDAKEGKDNKNEKEGKDEKGGKNSTTTTASGVGNTPIAPAKGVAPNGEPQAPAVVEGERVPNSETTTTTT